MTRRDLHAILIGSLLVLTGYFGPWIDHRAAGLVVSGLDLGEYVKFLPAIRNGDLHVWRQGFYLPLFGVSFVLSLTAFRGEYHAPLLLRIALLLIAAVAALNMLPPAWTPRLLLAAEFRLQTLAIALALAAALLSPLLALLPFRALWPGVALMAFASLLFTVRNFLRLLPDIQRVYHQSVMPGWGFYVTLVALAALLLWSLREVIGQRLKGVL